MSGYILLNICLAIWLYFDSKTRKLNGIPWIISTIIIGSISLPIYLAKRNLKNGETREGGFAWNLLKNFALFWTLTLAVCFFVGLMNISHDLHPQNDMEKAGAGIGVAIGGFLYLIIWFFPMVSAIVLGVFLKKSSIVEKGPTGNLAETISSDSNSLKPNSIPITSSPVFASPPPLPPQQTPKEKQIFIMRDNQQYGPYSEHVLKEWLIDGSVSDDDLVWHDGLQGWISLKNL